MGTNRFSGLHRFSGLFGGDGPSLLNRCTTVLDLLSDKKAVIRSMKLSMKFLLPSVHANLFRGKRILHVPSLLDYAVHT